MSNVIVILLGILSVSVALGWFFASRKTVEMPVRVMMFVGYFWLLAFIQLAVSAGAYYFWLHFLK